jgi:peptidoglycan/xylan/chitin deacetylase (PgdA/CDA1 family)
MGDLRAEGHEVGVHGVYHDGRLFSSEEVFEERLRVMEETAAQWGASGFRSPSLLYDLRLLTTRLRFSWDSSMPAWDPFQPQPGGCLRFVPFALNDRCVELPVTLWQDFTLFEELGMSDIEVWKRQIAWLHSIGGLINVIVHPDYLRSARRLDLYRSLLIELCGLDGAWRTLPNEVADWERERAAAAPAEEDRSPASRDQPRR